MGRVKLSEQAKKYENMINDLAKLHILTIRYIERNYNKRVITHRDMQRVLMGGKFTPTYQNGIETLKRQLVKLCKHEGLLNFMLDLEQRISNSDLKDMRFGVEPKGKFSDTECELENWLFIRQFYMDSGMITIKNASEILEIPTSTIKQACQSERLLNTKKVGKAWLVSIHECRQYWNKPVENDPKALYNNFGY